MEEAATRHAKAEDALERQLRVLNEAPPHYIVVEKALQEPCCIPKVAMWYERPLVPVRVETCDGASRVAAWVLPEDIDIIKFKERE